MEKLVTIQDLEQFKRDLISEIKELINANKETKWLKSKDVKRILGISGGTLQKMRNNHEIPFKPVGGVIFYSEAAINEHLSKSK